MFCPPRVECRLPPTKAIVAVPHQAAKLADGIDQQHACGSGQSAVGSRAVAAPSLPGKATAIQQCGHLVEAIADAAARGSAAAAGDRLQASRTPPAPIALRAPACCRPERRCRLGENPASSRRRLRAGIAAIGLGTVEFERAGDVDAWRDRFRARGTARRILHSARRPDRVDRASGRKPAAQATVAAKAALAQPAVDDGHGCPVLVGGANQIRPQFQLGQDQQRRPNATHRPAHGPTEIERAIEDRVLRVFLSRQSSKPVMVVVEITHSQSGRRLAISASSRASRLTSPTLTACSQTHGAVGSAPRHGTEELRGESFAILACGTAAGRRARARQ